VHGRRLPRRPAAAISIYRTIDHACSGDRARKNRLGQVANDAKELARYRYIMYIDDVPVDLASAACSTTTTNMTFPCSAALPKLSPGSHRLQLAVEKETDGERQRSLKSGALLLDVLPPNTSP
jgi:hypothetical protein